MPELVPPQLLEHVAARFRVLGDARRLAILRELMQGEEMSVGELVARLDSTQANISKHLGVLLNAGIVARRPVGTAAYYSVTDPSLKVLCDLVCNRLRDQAVEEARLLTTI
ncbi:MAG: metalloregulator ArsR/SmtB family transcription factor [bacterium]